MTRRGEDRIPATTPGNTARAGLAGAGGGTGLVLIADTLPTGSPWREVFTFVAPSASVVFGALVYYVEVQASRLLQQRLVGRLRRTLEEYLKNPHTSDDHKALLRRRLEEVENVITWQAVEHIRVVGTLPVVPAAQSVTSDDPG